MRVRILAPSAMEAKQLAPTGQNIVAELRPVQFARSQRNLYAVPFEVLSEQGTKLDCGYITVNAKNGRVSVEHRMKELVTDVDLPTEEEPKGKVKNA
jgi:pyruvate carboxylase